METEQRADNEAVGQETAVTAQERTFQGLAAGMVVAVHQAQAMAAVLAEIALRIGFAVAVMPCSAKEPRGESHPVVVATVVLG